MVKIIFHSPTVAEVNGEFISAPPPFPLGDCRGCSLVGIVCEDYYDYPCRGAAYFYEKETGKEVPYDELDENKELRDEVMDYKPCCWKCPFLRECLEDLREAGGDEYVRERYGISWEKFKDIVSHIQRHVINE
jgi:ferredoxin